MLKTLVVLGFFSCHAMAVLFKPVSAPWLRLTDNMSRLKIDPKGKYLAFVDGVENALHVIDLKTQNVYLVSKSTSIESSFFWSPHGFQIFYRELVSGAENAKISSKLRSYDCVLHKTIDVETLPFPTGIVTFNPVDFRMHYAYENGIRTKRLDFPGSRLAKWQERQKKPEGNWVVAQNGIIWMTHSGLSIKKIDDDGSPVESFDISPDGKRIVWATAEGHVYASLQGQESIDLGFGRDPVWHPSLALVLYSAGRMIGRVVANYDLRVDNMKNQGQWLTDSRHSSERWPQWMEEGSRILYTIDKTTDVFVMNFKK